MIAEELEKALSSQFVYEIYSSYIYLGLSAHLEKMKMPGGAHWLRIQTNEELEHANLFYVHLVNRDANITFGAIAAPNLEKVTTPEKAFELALKHELSVSERINALAGLAVKLKDYSTLNFLNYFLSEQIQEEKSVRDILDKFSISGECREGLLMLDSELGKRSAASVPKTGEAMA